MSRRVIMFAAVVALLFLLLRNPCVSQEPARPSSFTGHTKRVHSVAYGPDGKTLASISADRSLRLWDVKTGRNTLILRHEAEELPGLRFLDYPYDCERVAFSPDGKTLASGPYQHRYCLLWDLASGKCIAKLETGTIVAIAFSPDGMLLASGTFAVDLWDIKSGKKIARLGEVEKCGCKLEFSPDGKTLIVGTLSAISLWDLAKSKRTASVSPGNGVIAGMTVSPDGKTLAVAWHGRGNEREIKLFDLPSLKQHSTLNWLAVDFRPGEINEMTGILFSPDGKTLAVSGFKGTDEVIQLWDLPSQKLPVQLKTGGERAFSPSFSPDGKMLAYPGEDCSIKVLPLNPLGE